MRARSLHTAVLGAAIAILAVVAPALRVGAAPASACTTTAGVTVIVDFTHFGGEIQRGCAAGQPTTALAAMHAAGFETAGTTRYGDAFLCRIANLPAPKNEACADTAPASSSWSFYNARPNDATWTYTTVGVLTYRPSSGSIIAFAFGNFAKPGIRPAAAIPRPPTTVTIADPTIPTAAPVTTPPTRPAITVAPPTTARIAAPRAIAAHATSTTVASTVPDATTSTSPRIVDRTATGTISHDSSGSPVPAAITAAIVVLLAAAAGVTIAARRRRSA